MKQIAHDRQIVASVHREPYCYFSFVKISSVLIRMYID